MVTPMNWIRTNVATSAAIGVLALALVGGGTAVAVTSAQQAITETATPSPTPSSLPTSAASEDPFTATGPTTTAPTTPDGSAPGTSNGQPSTGQPDPTAPEPPAPVVEPPAPPAPVSPDAPTWVSISPDGEGFAISWADAPMNGLTLKYYRVGVANPSYTSGEEYTTGGTWLAIPGVTSGNNCAFITAVATNGTVGPTSSVCTDLW